MENPDNPRIIGLIGNGYVGGAHRDCATRAGFTVHAFDLNPQRSTVASIDQLVRLGCDPIIVCVNTPERSDGACDTSQVEDACRKLNAAAGEWETRPNVLLKSTVPPTTTCRLRENFPDLHIAFSPEFLRETHPEDLTQRGNVILSGDPQAIASAAVMYQRILPEPLVIFRTDSTLAELVKYSTNLYLAAKVAFFNELFDLCEALNAPFDEFRTLVTLDPRVGESHTQVPGVHGRGFGGHCLPKDGRAIIRFAELQNVCLHVGLAAFAVNYRLQQQHSKTAEATPRPASHVAPTSVRTEPSNCAI